MTDRTTIIIGGTGTLGNALLETMDTSKVIVFSRDELKQQQLKQKYPDLKCVIGDIRSKRSLDYCYEDNQIENVFHVAALKHVDVLEDNPEEAYRTNVLGTIVSAELAKNRGVFNFYFSSTDKAVMPINVYGMTKAISERYLLNQNRGNLSTMFRVFRWGNILGSRGSVVGLFAKSLKEEGKVRITDNRMTRFWLPITDAVDFMLNNNMDHRKVNFPDMKGARVIDLAQAIANVLNIKKFKIESIPIRPGEKLHECVYSSHDVCIRSDNSARFTQEELENLVRPILEKI